MSNNIVLDLAFLLDEVNNAQTPETAKTRIAGISTPLEFVVALTGPDAPDADQFRFYDLSGRVVVDTLRQWNPQIQAVDLMSDKHLVRIWMTTNKGTLSTSFARSRVSVSNPHQFLVLMFSFGLLMALVSFVFLRNQLRPIRSLAKAAEAFGRGEKMAYQPSGAVEIRLAGNAFLNMRQRIERHVEQRTNILSGVSHDLRTPLTRLKLGLSMLDDTDEVKDLQQDVDDMGLLLDEFLSFVRDGALGDLVVFDPVAIVRDEVEKATRNGGKVVLGTINNTCMIEARPVSLARALNNLISNALRYGTQAHLSVAILAKSVTISVEDDGPGIPADQRSDALEPFVRLEPSRNQNKGAGIGLGLAITSDIMRQHGGTLTLSESDRFGGLKATLVLPR